MKINIKEIYGRNVEFLDPGTYRYNIKEVRIERNDHPSRGSDECEVTIYVEPIKE